MPRVRSSCACVLALAYRPHESNRLLDTSTYLPVCPGPRMEEPRRNFQTGVYFLKSSSQKELLLYSEYVMIGKIAFKQKSGSWDQASLCVAGVVVLRALRCLTLLHFTRP